MQQFNNQPRRKDTVGAASRDLPAGHTSDRADPSAAEAGGIANQTSIGNGADATEFGRINNSFGLLENPRQHFRSLFRGDAGFGPVPVDPTVWQECFRLLFEKSKEATSELIADTYTIRVFAQLPALTLLRKLGAETPGSTPFDNATGAALGVGVFAYGVLKSELGCHVLQELSLRQPGSAVPAYLVELLRLLYRVKIFSPQSPLSRILERPDRTAFETALLTGLVEVYRELSSPAGPSLSPDALLQRFRNWLQPQLPPPGALNSALERILENRQPYLALVAAVPVIGSQLQLDPGLTDFMVRKLIHSEYRYAYAVMDQLLLANSVPQNLIERCAVLNGVARLDPVLELIGLAIAANHIFQRDQLVFNQWSRRLQGVVPEGNPNQLPRALRLCVKSLLSDDPQASLLCRTLKSVEYGGAADAALISVLRGVLRIISPVSFGRSLGLWQTYLVDLKDAIEVRRARSQQKTIGFSKAFVPPLSSEHLRFLRDLVKERYLDY